MKKIILTFLISVSLLAQENQSKVTADDLFLQAYQMLVECTSEKYELRNELWLTDEKLQVKIKEVRKLQKEIRLLKKKLRR